MTALKEIVTIQRNGSDKQILCRNTTLSAKFMSRNSKNVFEVQFKLYWTQVSKTTKSMYPRLGVIWKSVSIRTIRFI